MSLESKIESLETTIKSLIKVLEMNTTIFKPQEVVTIDDTIKPDIAYSIKDIKNLIRKLIDKGKDRDVIKETIESISGKTKIAELLYEDIKFVYCGLEKML